MRRLPGLWALMLLAGAARAEPPEPAQAGEGITVNGQTPAPMIKPLGGGGTFVSPMGEPFRTQGGDVSAAETWFRQTDANHDNRISRQEFAADATRFFALLDTDHDREIGPLEIQHYESDIAPEVRVGSTYGDPTLAKTDDDGNVTPPPYPTRLGAGRFGFLNAPEPIVSADLNLDRAITAQEFSSTAERRFKMLDANEDGYLTRDELPRLDNHSDGHSGGGRAGGHGGHRRHGPME